MASNGELPHLKIGRLLKFRSEDIDEYVERRLQCLDVLLYDDSERSF
jgi:predicted DNA-binding transcriptional regulator AlpA